MTAEQLIRNLRATRRAATRPKQADGAKVMQALTGSFARGLGDYQKVDAELEGQPDLFDDRLDSNMEFAAAAWHAAMMTAKVLLNYADKRNYQHAQRALKDLADELDSAVYWAGRAKATQDAQ